MNMVEIYVFRHGQTDWNREQRLQGHTDIPLNETGRSQAQELSLKVKELGLEVVLSSDLSRALETAEIATQDLNVPIYQSAALREGNLGKAEGLLKTEALEVLGAESWNRWLSVSAQDQDFVFEGGESKKEHLQRMISFIEAFIHEHTDICRIGISTHGGSLRRLIHHCENAPEEAVALPNCALYKVTYNRQSKTWTFN